MTTIDFNVAAENGVVTPGWAGERFGDLETARELHYGLHPLVDLLFVETNPAPAKWVLERWGKLASAHVRPPLDPVTDANLPEVKRLLAEGAAYADGPAR